LRKRIAAAIFFVLLLGVGTLVYLGQRTVQLKELYYSGTIEARRAELSFQVSGRVIDIPTDEGQFVKENQLMAALDQSEYQARYEQAKANLESVVLTQKTNMEIQASVNSFVRCSIKPFH